MGVDRIHRRKPRNERYTKERKTCVYELGIDSTQRDTRTFSVNGSFNATMVMTTRSIYAIICDYIYVHVYMYFCVQEV